MTDLLGGLSIEAVRQMSIEALRRWYRAEQDARRFTVHGSLGRHLVPVLAERKGVEDADVNSLKEPFLTALAEPQLEPVLEFLTWMVNCGYALPLGSSGMYPTCFHLTYRGKALLSSTGDHPSLPGFMSRLSNRCPDLPEAALTHMQDARACLELGLNRPSVVLLGVGYEAVVDEIVDRLIQRHLLHPKVKAHRAAKRIAALRDEVVPRAGDTETRFAARHACDFADHVRQRRNDAAHTAPRYDFTDGSEVEELLVSAGRHLPWLWALAGVGP